MSWLNAEADPNMRYILVTEDVSHAEMSALNSDFDLNVWNISVT
jgi:hypothetical protein